MMNPENGGDIWAAPIDHPDQAYPLVKTSFNETQAQVSPDGHWLAYTSNESGSSQVYVQAIGSSSPRWQVSGSGGSDAKWRHDGGELYYVATDGDLMAVQTDGVATIGPSKPQALLRIPGSAVTPYSMYDVGTDGRFLVHFPVEDVRTTPLTVVVGWIQPAAAN